MHEDIFEAQVVESDMLGEAEPSHLPGEPMIAGGLWKCVL